MRMKRLGYVALGFAGLSFFFLVLFFIGNTTIDYAERWSCTTPTGVYFFFKQNLDLIMRSSAISAFLGLAILPWLKVEGTW